MFIVELLEFVEFNIDSSRLYFKEILLYPNLYYGHHKEYYEVSLILHLETL